MKKYVWSETRVEGGHPFTGSLPKPPSATGAYQNQPGGGRGFGGRGQTQAPPPEYHADAVAVAFKAPESDCPVTDMKPKVSSSGGSFDVAALTDGDLSKATLLPAAPVGQRSWIQYEFADRATYRGLTFVTSGGGGFGFGRGGGGASNQQLEASDNGRQFRVGATSKRTSKTTWTSTRTPPAGSWESAGCNT